MEDALLTAWGALELGCAALDNQMAHCWCSGGRCRRCLLAEEEHRKHRIQQANVLREMMRRGMACNTCGMVGVELGSTSECEFCEGML